MYRFQLSCLAEAYGTTFECDIEEAETIIVSVIQDASHTPDGYSYDELHELYCHVFRKGKTVDIVEFGQKDTQPIGCSLSALRVAVDDVLARSNQDLR